VSHMPNIKLMKLPLFHKEKDDLDAYLNRFERTCRAFNVPQALGGHFSWLDFYTVRH